jgi:hypothetical protein
VESEESAGYCYGYVEEVNWTTLLMQDAEQDFTFTLSIECIYSNIYPTRCNFTQFILSGKLLYTLRVVPPPATRAATKIATASCMYHVGTAT